MAQKLFRDIDAARNHQAEAERANARAERIRENDQRRQEQSALKPREHAVVDQDLQHRQYGGFHLGSAFVGWLVSSGLATILLALLAAAGATFAVTQVRDAAAVNSDTAAAAGAVGGLVFALVMGVAYFVGGYVAGRMSRFDGARQGIGVWAFGLIVTITLALAGAILGAKYNLMSQLNLSSLPTIPVSNDSISMAGLLTAILTLAVTLGAAILGGKVGTRYHRKVDNAGTVERAIFTPQQRHVHGH